MRAGSEGLTARIAAILCSLGSSPVVLGSKELQAAASENANWSSYYLDYKALKQILGQLTRTQMDNQTEGNAQVRCTRSHVRSLSPHPRAPALTMRVLTGRQLEGLFLSSLMLQILKVNTFYHDKAQELGEHLER